MVRENEGDVALLAVTFTRLLLPGLYPFLLYRVFASYLTAQNTVYVPLAIGVLANICNIIFNTLLVSGINYQALGFIGAPIGTSMARVIMALTAFGVIIFLYLKQRKTSSTPRTPILVIFKETIEWRGMWEFIKLAVPSTLMQCLGMWGFQLASVLTARIGEKSVSAHGIVLNFAIQTFMVPAAIASATAIRVGQRLGAQDTKGAKWVCWLGVALGIIFMLINGTIMISIRSFYSKLFIDDEQVRLLVEKIMPIGAFYQVFDGAQAVCAGVLRGLGKQYIGAMASFVAYFIIGIPLGYLLAFYFEWELVGLWWGLAVGLVVVSAILMSYLIFRIDWIVETRKAQERIKVSDSKVAGDPDLPVDVEASEEQQIETELIEKSPQGEEEREQ
jgi:MATE family multidrug resistance protein